MKITLVFSQTPDTQSSLRVHSRIRTGNSTIYCVCSNRQDYAVKIFSNTNQGKACYEREKVAQHLAHPNIVKYVPIVANRSDEEHRLVTEYAKNGRFSDILEIGPLKTEALVRTYFHQLIEGIEYIHSQGFVHLDLTLDNLVVGSDYSLKIIDFDKSEMIPSANSALKEAANISIEKQKKLKAFDIFSAGMILFALSTGKLPFVINKEFKDDQTKGSRSYSHFLKNNKEFWNKLSRGYFNKIKPSEEFIDLVNRILTPNLEERASIEDIKASEWYRGPVIQTKDLEAMMRPICRKAQSKVSRLWSMCLLVFAHSSS